MGAESHGAGRVLVTFGRQVSDRVKGLPDQPVDENRQLLYISEEMRSDSYSFSIPGTKAQQHSEAGSENHIY